MPDYLCNPLLPSTEVAQANDATVVRALLGEALRHLRLSELEGVARCIKQATHLIALPSEAIDLRDRRSGGLAHWQARKVADHIEAHLEDPLRLETTAAIVTRSPSYFARAFRASFGQSFHQYVIRLRIQRACRLMMSTSLPLSAIALECGLADQAHLSRLFKRMTGETPGQWRRCRRFEPGTAFDTQSYA